MTTDRHILKMTCEDRPGIVAAVTRVIAEAGGNIAELHQFNDTETGKFLMRVDVAAPDAARIAFNLRPVIERFDMRHQLIPASRRGRVLILASKQDHCLVDLLYRWRKGALAMEVAGIVSNHQEAGDIAAAHGLDFDHLPVTRDTRQAQEARLSDIIEARSVDLVVLARYMQILSDDLATSLYGKVINIHHSFLPSFKGARPYHQAHARGVKLIGATAHYVTPDLDEGPIIEQEVARAKHADTVEDLIRIGRDTEARVLARAVGWHLDHRVFLNGAKTVVFT